MSKLTPVVTSRHATGDKGTLKAYIVGFISSIILTLAVYFFVQQQANSGHTAYSAGVLTAIIVTLALVQLAVQLKFFIHLGHESKPSWNKLAFLFMFIVVVILVGGSLWIMDNLHYNMMTPQETETYMQSKEGIL